MAEALISVVLEQLGSFAIRELVKEVELLAGVEEEVESLTGTLTLIQGVLEDAEQKQVTNKGVKFWLDKIKEISYDVDDVLDEWSTRILISKMQQPDVNAPIKEKMQSHLFSFFCCVKPIVIHHAIGVKIRELNGQLEGLAKKKDMYKLTEIRSHKESRLLTSSIVDVSDFYGRQVDKEVIMSKIFSESSHQDMKVPVISIVGTGGFGKTTLAQMIIKEKQVINHFEKQIWVCVSDPFDHEKVAKQIIEEATSNSVDDNVGWQALHRKLSESVKGKRYILVLDDVWSFNGEIWKQLKTSFDGGVTGSRIIITTRDKTIADRMGSTYIHWLGQLSDDDSWLMFRRIAFWRRDDDLEIMEDIAKDIAQRCRGVPLSIRVLASLMRLKKTIQDWRNVQASNMWDIQLQEGGAEGFLPSILFSYYALPTKLKPCLVYCAILPKDTRIEKKKMVELWMAQGFLGSDGSKDLELEGGQNFDDLAMRSFFQDFEEDFRGNITYCKMHDLVHDFVQFLSKSETFILNETEELKNVNVCHLSTLSFDLPSICKLKKLRTLRLLDYLYDPHKITNLGLLHVLTCLRVLDLSRSDLQELPSDIEMLLHLRYLNLSQTKLKELPETICNLLNLQTLKLEGCSELANLPKGIRKLCNLRHLVIEGTKSLKYLPHGLGILNCLRTLSNFIICDEDEIEGEGCNIRELGLLDHLQCELRISNLDRVANENEVAEANLKKKKNLRSLILSFSKKINGKRRLGDVEILEGLVPHTNLEELKVLDYKGAKLPDWISLLSNLVKLHLRGLNLQLPVLGKLPFLEVLVLGNLTSVERIGKEFYGLSSCGGGGRDSLQQVVFPRLKKLNFSRMDNWEEWDLPYQNGNKIDFFPNLVELCIYNCGLQALPSGLGELKSLQSLKLDCMGALKSFFSEEILEILSNDSKGGGVEEEDNGEFIKPPITTTVVVLFPALTYLELIPTPWRNRETIPELKVDSMSTTSITIMPLLTKLEIKHCSKLMAIPFYMFAHGLKISYYPNLHYFEISYSSQSSLPKGFNQLTSIRQLVFRGCKFLDFGPYDLKHLTMLEELRIYDCPVLAQRFKEETQEREISSSSSPMYNISISSEPINSHFGHRCDNCEMNPIVLNRYKCKDCYDEGVVSPRGGRGFDLCEKCFNTPSKHTDFVKQHHRKGHTFELIENRGDNPVLIHLDDPSEDAEGGLVAAKPAEIVEQNKA